VGFEEFYPPLNTWFDVRAYPSELGLAVYFRDITEAKRTAEEIKFKNTMLMTQQETSLDAILVVGENSQIISYNQQFAQMWQIPAQIVRAGLDAPVLQAVADQVENPETFVARVQYLYEHRDEKSHEEIPLKDGRIVDRYSAPVTGADGKYYGRVWYFRDITEGKQSERVVRDSQKRFKAIFDQAPIAMALLDAQGHPTLSNLPLSKMVGYSNDELSKMTFSDFTYPEDVDKDLNQFAELMEGKIAKYNMEKRYVHKDGHLIWANLFVTILRDEHGLPQEVIGMAEDITDRKQAEARIKYLSRVQAVLSGINALIVRVRDRDELFREACRVAVDKGGFRMAMLVIVDPGTKKVVSIASAGKNEELLTLIKDRLSSSVDVSDTMVGMVIKGGETIVSNDSLNDTRLVFRDKYAESVVRSMVILPLIVSDEVVGTISLYASEIDFFHEEELNLLTELAGDIAFAIDHIGKQERINYLAYYDVLTGLANRTLFLDRVAQYMRSAISGGHQLAIGLIDLERFKNINDSLGRTAGDVLLRQVAEWLTYKTGDANLLARIDADHFALVLPEVRQDGDLARLVENTMDAFLQHPFLLNDTVFRISVRVGVSLFPDDGTEAETLFRNAEAALKKAKAGGDRYLFYTPQMTAAVAGKLSLENQLRQAIDNEEFVLYYQPKVNLVSGKVTSAEALIRWNDPRTGLVPPGKFIPILEETGLIYEVGRWALRQAIADYLRWRAMGLPAVRIAVNVSPLQLRSHGFVAEIERKIGIGANAAEGLELEITESLIMEDVKHSITSLQAIRALGVTIAIDDFGTGFSSLSYLAKLPVDTLKIDRAFVIEMDKPEGLALVSTIIILAHALKLKVVAEGVETEQQLRQLLSLNCDEMQGFLFSKPVPAEIFEAKFLAPLTPADEQ
jgi:diguanylate cyclase (GGDEF)-like protein/PAS domain S-box-containing protein